MYRWIVCCVLLLHSAWLPATSCARQAVLDPGAPGFDEAALAQQARSDLATFGLVAEVELLAMDGREILGPLATSLRLARVRALHYFRRPLDDGAGTQADNEYWLVVHDGTEWPPGEQRLILAFGEDDESRRRRQHPDPESLLDDAWPADIRERLWIAYSECRAIVHEHSASGRALRAALAAAAQASAATASLRLRLVAQDGSGAQSLASGSITVALQSLVDGRQHQVLVDGAQGGRIELPAGRYRAHWAGVDGARSWCSSGQGSACQIELLPGLEQQLALVYEGDARVDVDILDAHGAPVDILAWISLRALTPVAAGQPAHADVALDVPRYGAPLRDRVSANPRYRVRAGEYAVLLRAGRPGAHCPSSDPRAQPLALRLLRADEPAPPPDSTPVVATSVSLQPGRQRVHVRLPASEVYPLVRLRLERADAATQATVMSDCLALHWRPDWQDDADEVLAPRGQTVTVLSHCEGCASASSQKLLMDRDRSVFLDRAPPAPPDSP